MTAVVATAVVPQYFPVELDLPLSPEHKTWYTERLCPPLLAQALKSEKQAMFIAQLHYWLQKEGVGVNRHGFHWIYNTEWEWRDQFPWMSEHTIGRIRRKLEQLGYVVSNDFNRNPLDRTKHSTLDYYRIALETGWNPLGLDLNRSYENPPQFIKGIRLRGRHKSDTTPLVYKPVDLDESKTPKPAKNADSAQLQNASCTNATMHSALLPLSSIYKYVPYISKSNLEPDLKIESDKANKQVASGQLLGKENALSPQIAEQQQTASRELIESPTVADSSTQASPDDDETINAPQQFLVSLNAQVELAERCRKSAAATSPIRIPGVDEQIHEIVWHHQAQLVALNADLHAPRIQSAIADNPQHLEDAIEAFYENSASGAKTQAAATGFLYNALRHGWKPRHCAKSAAVQVYTPPPQMLEEHQPATLEQLVERKRLMWQNAPILRSQVSAWVEQTPGVVMTDNGPALANATAQPSHPDIEPIAASHPVTLPVAEASSPIAKNAASPQLEPSTLSEVEPHQGFNSALPQTEVHLANLTASSPTVTPAAARGKAALLPTKESPSTSSQAQQKQRSSRRLQPVEILSSAGDWVAGYFIHSCIAIANLVGIEQKLTLFDADGEAYTFLGQVRPL